MPAAAETVLWSIDGVTLSAAVVVNVYMVKRRRRTRALLRQMEADHARAERDLHLQMHARIHAGFSPATFGADAESRATGLLFEFLTPEQRDAWERSGCFAYTSPKTGNTYIIGERSMAFTQVGRRGDLRRRGYHCLWGVPRADIALCQLLSLMGDEKKVLKVACG